MILKRLTMILAVSLAILPTHISMTHADSSPAFVPSRCPVQFGSTNNVECGIVAVPQDRENLEEGMLNLSVAIFKAQSSTPAADPLIFLDGGPGSRTLDSFARGLGNFLGTLNYQRDVIIFDYRGIGHSEPALTCPEGVNATNDDWITKCRDRHEAEGVDVTDFTTRDNAADAAAIIRALGYDTYNIWGGSYGSSVAMTLLRDYPENIRAAIVTALQPPQGDLQASSLHYVLKTLDSISALCQRDASCSAAYPNDLRDELAAVVERLEANPFKVAVNNNTVEVKAITVLAVLSELLKDEKNIPIVPGFIAALSAEQYDQVIPYVDKLYVPTDALNPYGAWLSMRCTDSILATTPRAMNAVLSTLTPAFQNVLSAHHQRQVAMCEAWGARLPTDADRLPAVTDIPALLISGALDPYSSQEWLNSTLDTLPNGQGFMLPYHAHYVIHNSCASRLLTDFIVDPTKPVDSSCMAQIEPPQFQ